MTTTAPATVNKALAAVRGVLRAAWRLGLIDTDAYTRAANVRNVKGSRLPAGRSLDHDKLAALFSACASDTSPAGARDAAAFVLMFGAGLRRAEAADYDAETGAVRVIGKGDKERIVYATNGGKATFG